MTEYGEDERVPQIARWKVRDRCPDCGLLYGIFGCRCEQNNAEDPPKEVNEDEEDR